MKDALLFKHPEPCIPLPCYDALPLFEYVEICAAHVQAAACMIQGGAGPGAAMLINEVSDSCGCFHSC